MRVVEKRISASFLSVSVRVQSIGMAEEGVAEEERDEGSGTENRVCFSGAAVFRTQEEVCRKPLGAFSPSGVEAEEFCVGTSLLDSSSIERKERPRMKNALSLTGILKWIVKHYKTIAIATGTLIAVFGFVGVERQRIVSGTAIPDGVAYINPERSAKVRLASDISGFRCRIVLRDGFEEMQITQYRFDPDESKLYVRVSEKQFHFSEVDVRIAVLEFG